MNGYQAQCSVLALIFFSAFVCFAVLAVTAKRTWFVGVIGVSSLLFTGTFGILALSELTSVRAEVIASLLPEVPFIFLLSAPCLALAGSLPARFGSVTPETVARRPRLQTVLKAAPLLLLTAWTVALIVGLLWPSPALRFYADAPIQFVVMRWLLMFPEGFYSALVGALFLAMAKGAPRWRLRVKNAAFSLGAFSWAVMAINATVSAGVRVWAPEDVRRAMMGAHLVLEANLAVLSMLAFAIGLTLRYVPGIAGSILRRLHEGLLVSQDRFESLRWRSITGGRVRGVIRASQYATEAAGRERLTEAEVEKTLTTIQLIAVLEDTSAETNELTAEKARELLKLQKEVFSNADLASKLKWANDQRQVHGDGQAYRVGSLYLHDALGAALELIEGPVDEEDVPERVHLATGRRPLWFYIAAVSAAEAGLLDMKTIEHRACVVGDRHTVDRAQKAHEEAKRSAKGLTLGKI